MDEVGVSGVGGVTVEAEVLALDDVAVAEFGTLEQVGAAAAECEEGKLLLP